MIRDNYLAILAFMFSQWIILFSFKLTPVPSFCVHQLVFLLYFIIVFLIVFSLFSPILIYSVPKQVVSSSFPCQETIYSSCWNMLFFIWTCHHTSCDFQGNDLFHDLPSFLPSLLWTSCVTKQLAYELSSKHQKMNWVLKWVWFFPLTNITYRPTCVATNFFNIEANYYKKNQGYHLNEENS